MPNYTYRNIETGKIEELSMSISEMEEFEQRHSNRLERVYSTVNVVDPAGIGVAKPPADFSKHVLGRIKAGHHKSEIGNGRWKVPREI